MTSRRDHAGLLGRILAALGSADALTRDDAARALDRAEVSLADAPALVEAFARATERAGKGPLSGKALERDEATRAPLARALARLGPAAREAVGDLVKALERGGPELSDEAVFALETVGPDEAAALLVGRLAEGELGSRGEALRAVRHAAFVLEPRLAYAHLRRDATLAPRLARALSSRGEEALFAACDEPSLRPHALTVLGYLGPQLGRKGEALAKIMAALEAGAEGGEGGEGGVTMDDASRLAAASAIGFWGEEARAAVTTLVSLLSTPLAAAAAESLGRMGEAALPVLPALERALPALDRPSREAALSAIARLRELAEEPRPHRRGAQPEPEPQPQPEPEPQPQPPPRSKPEPSPRSKPEPRPASGSKAKGKRAKGQAPSLRALLDKAKAAAAATRKGGAKKSKGR